MRKKTGHITLYALLHPSSSELEPRPIHRNPADHRGQATSAARAAKRTHEPLGLRLTADIGKVQVKRRRPASRPLLPWQTTHATTGRLGIFQPRACRRRSVKAASVQKKTGKGTTETKTKTKEAPLSGSVCVLPRSQDLGLGPATSSAKPNTRDRKSPLPAPLLPSSRVMRRGGPLTSTDPGENANPSACPSALMLPGCHKGSQAKFPSPTGPSRPAGPFAPPFLHAAAEI
jgi:hypothetical protein